MALGREGLLELEAGPDSIMPKLFKDCEKNTASEVGFQRGGWQPNTGVQEMQGFAKDSEALSSWPSESKGKRAMRLQPPSV